MSPTPDPQCCCRWCTLPRWAIPTAAAALVVLVLVVLGGGQRPGPVDVVVYVALATVTYSVTAGPVARSRRRHDDWLFDEQDR
ncbi:hypothetical protein SAMN05428942_7297 [Streptomyces sp. 2112.2]|uniref:hypothetical protein n=1 Tax=Streptomyces sp. 2112.2 TaxID=1881024 RepID=UPI0008963DBB|nr:hypothetical protein [Streptomyces sp. 2112.2]SEF16560.1 hypothetical protein SAMN05428942_7297 [Streptomyces sp. 2112.2]